MDHSIENIKMITLADPNGHCVVIVRCSTELPFICDLMEMKFNMFCTRCLQEIEQIDGFELKEIIGFAGIEILEVIER